jgi:hypothetical protein
MAAIQLALPPNQNGVCCVFPFAIVLVGKKKKKLGKLSRVS